MLSFFCFFPTTCLQQPRHISLLELESPLSSVFQTRLPLPGCWLEYAPHFLEFSEIKVITFLNQKPVVWFPHPALVTGVIYVVPICAHFLVMALRIRCFQLFKQTIPHQQAASNNVHTCRGGAEVLQGKDTAGNRQTEQCSWPAPCSPPLRPLSHGQQARESCNALFSQKDQCSCSRHKKGYLVPVVLTTASLSYDTCHHFAYFDLKAISSSKAGLTDPQPIEQSP